MSKQEKKQSDVPVGTTSASSPTGWLRADYHFHMFHYRMPETVAIASVTPFVPSSLTVKMALIAALLQDGDYQSAEQLVPHLSRIVARVVPPSAAFSFKAFLRYRSVPAVGSAGSLDESGSYYPSRPHTREYALFASELTIFLGLPDSTIADCAERALRNIRYIGCKDSIVTCIDVQEVSENQLQDDLFVQPLNPNLSGPVILGADFVDSAKPTLHDLIPGSRKEEHYRRPPPLFVLPGKIVVKGRSRVFQRR